MATQAGPGALGRWEATGWAPIQMAAAAVGMVFLLVGVLGFVPGITSNLGDIEFVDHESDAELLGLFQVNILHNIVHLLFGVFGLMLARTIPSARSFLLLGGAAYLALWLYGAVIDLDESWNFVALNTADNWLHAGLGVGMLAIGAAVPKGRPATTR